MNDPWTDDDTRAVMERLYRQALGVGPTAAQVLVIVAAALDEVLRRKHPGTGSPGEGGARAVPEEEADDEP